MPIAKFHSPFDRYFTILEGTLNSILANYFQGYSAYITQLDYLWLRLPSGKYIYSHTLGDLGMG